MLFKNRFKVSRAIFRGKNLFFFPSIHWSHFLSKNGTLENKISLSVKILSYLSTRVSWGKKILCKDFYWKFFVFWVKKRTCEKSFSMVAKTAFYVSGGTFQLNTWDFEKKVFFKFVFGLRPKENWISGKKVNSVVRFLFYVSGGFSNENFLF